MHQPRKRFGQHFLRDSRVIQQIIDSFQLKPDDIVVEIGPGLGALTTHILPLIKKLQVIELDRDIVPQLINRCQGLGELIVHQTDVLRFDFSQLTTQENSLRLVGNLPYNISAPLLFHVLSHVQLIKDMHFMLQKEVVDRIVAKPGDDAYGRLSVMVQYYCEAHSLFMVGPEAFNPPPKVNSAIVRLVPHPPGVYTVKDIKLFTEVVRLAFGQRRKTLRNSLRTLVSEQILLSLNIDPNLRAERLSVQDFIRITDAI